MKIKIEITLIIITIIIIRIKIIMKIIITIIIIVILNKKIDHLGSRDGRASLALLSHTFIYVEKWGAWEGWGLLPLKTPCSISSGENRLPPMLYRDPDFPLKSADLPSGVLGAPYLYWRREEKRRRGEERMKKRGEEKKRKEEERRREYEEEKRRGGRMEENKKKRREGKER